RGFDHEVFPADLVGGDGDGKAVAQGADDIQVGAGRCHHDHVGPFGEVEFRFANGFQAVGRVHLVGFFVAGLGCGIKGTAKRAIVGGGVFGGVAEDGDVPLTGTVEGGTDGTDPSIHHVAGRNDIRP